MIAVPAHGDDSCAEGLAGPTAPGDFVAAFGETADGEADGTVGILLPGSEGALSWQIVAEVRFEGHRYRWTEGPFTADAGDFVDWEIRIPDEARMEDGQFDYLSDLVVTVEIVRDGRRVLAAGAGSARVAFEPGSEPLVLTRDEAAELAPGDAWGDGVEPRIERVPAASVSRPVAVERDARPHSEEVDG